MKSLKLIGAVAAIAIMLCGCGTKPSGQETANAAGGQTQTQSASQPQQAPAQGNGQDKNQAPGRMQMMRVFQLLMDMDKEDGLAITKEQAQSMLPVVQASITAAELTDADKSKLLLPLTDAQKKFIDNAAAQMSERRESNVNGEGVKPRKNGDAPKPADKPQKNANDQHAAKDGGGDGKDKDAGQAPKNGGAKGDSEKKQGDAAGKPPGDGQGNNGMGPRGRDGGQQLIELLQSKLK